jgi:hypothetical protein
VSNQDTPATDNGAQVSQSSNKKSFKRQGVPTQLPTQLATHGQAAGYSGDYMDLQAVAQALGVSMNTVRRKRKAGELPRTLQHATTRYNTLPSLLYATVRYCTLLYATVRYCMLPHATTRPRLAHAAVVL